MPIPRSASVGEGYSQLSPGLPAKGGAAFCLPSPNSKPGDGSWANNGAEPARARAASTEPRPNILFIFTDDHAQKAIGAYGGRLASLNPTPNIDRLAASGMLFQNSFCSNSICGPSRAVILTGKHSHRNGFMNNGNRFDGGQQTFPKLLRKIGYQTAVIGKWHLKSEPQGFDYWDVLPGQGDYYNPKLISPSGRRTVEGYCTDIVTDLAIDWLKSNAKSGKPFMLMCQHKAPHRNWMPALRHLNLYDEREIPEPDTLFDSFETHASPARHQEMEIDRHMNIVYDLFVNPHEGWDPKRGTDKSGFRNLQKMTAAQRKAWTTRNAWPGSHWSTPLAGWKTVRCNSVPACFLPGPALTWGC